MGVWTGKQGQAWGQCVSWKASRPHTGGGISTTHWGRHLDRTLGEASRPHIGGGISITYVRGQSSRPLPWGGISTTHWGRHLDRSPARGISQRQSKSMTGSLDLLSASRSLKARGISIARRREAFHSAISGGKPRPIVGISIARRREAFHSVRANR